MPTSRPSSGTACRTHSTQQSGPHRPAAAGSRRLRPIAEWIDGVHSMQCFGRVHTCIRVSISMSIHRTMSCHSSRPATRRPCTFATARTRCRCTIPSQRTSLSCPLRITVGLLLRRHTVLHLALRSRCILCCSGHFACCMCACCMLHCMLFVPRCIFANSPRPGAAVPPLRKGRARRHRCIPPGHPAPVHRGSISAPYRLHIGSISAPYRLHISIADNTCKPWV